MNIFAYSVLVILLLLFGTNVRAASPQEARLGLAAPFTGPAASFGETVKAGFDFAIRRSNQETKSQQIKFTGVYEDDACDPKQAINAANVLIGRGVLSATHICDAPSETVKQVYIENETVLASITKRAAITEGGQGFVFQVMASHDDYAHLIYDNIIKGKHNPKIGILATKDYYGLGLYDALNKILVAHNQGFDFQEMITDTGTMDYSALLAKAKRQKIDILVLSVWDHMVGRIIRQARDIGLSAIIVGGDSGGDVSIPQIAGDAANGFIFASVDFLDQLGKDPVLLHEMQRERITPHLYTLYGYFIANVLIEAVKQTHDLTNRNFITTLHNGEFKTPFGSITFDQQGHAKGVGSSLYIWRDGNVHAYNY